VLDAGGKPHPPQQRQEAAVDHDHPVGGVLDDISEVVGMKTEVERVQHGAHGRNREIGLQMLMMVPGERADPVPRANTQLPEGHRELPRALEHFSVAIPIQGAVLGATDNGPVGVHGGRPPHNRRNRELIIHDLRRV
jgi:hypothetical protein